ncbi:MAG: cell division/cell wall cluster transcriptional repressor MraZ [Clostridia bacterium]|nr:cell division/cell wall cluster transcriptional repressor MraZ [Clostridia bacterium]
MFIGTYEHNMDSKNRVFVPVKFREELGETIYYRLYASKENPSIQLYSKDEFEREFSNAVPNMNNQAKKKKLLSPIFLTANIASYDSQGRITINSVIAENAGLEKECIFVGFGSYVELMSKKSYNASLQMVCEDNEADEAAVEKEADVYRQMMGEGRFLDAEGE